MYHLQYERIIKVLEFPTGVQVMFPLSLFRRVVPADPDVVGILAARAVENAVYRAVRAAKSLHGKPALRDIAFSARAAE